MMSDPRRHLSQRGQLGRMHQRLLRALELFVEDRQLVGPLGDHLLQLAAEGDIAVDLDAARERAVRIEHRAAVTMVGGLASRRPR